MGKHGGYGWVPDLPDNRDLLYAAPAPPAPLPSAVDLGGKCTPVYDQGQLGSCTGNAIAGALDFERLRQGLPAYAPSRLFIYYNERVMEHTVNSDAGAQIRDGIKSVAKFGACSENPASGAPINSIWAYDIAQFEQKPPPPCYAASKLDRVLSYMRLSQTLAQLKGCLAAGFPFVFGITVYASFESDAVAKSGDVPLPSPGEQVMGGHAVMAVGYDDTAGRFLVRNSWGPSWGKNGYFTLPYAYPIDPHLASDFWTIRLVG